MFPLILVLSIQLTVLSWLFFKFLGRFVATRNLFNSLSKGTILPTISSWLHFHHLYLKWSLSFLVFVLFIIPLSFSHSFTVFKCLIARISSFLYLLHSWVLFEWTHSLIFLQNSQLEWSVVVGFFSILLHWSLY